MSLLKLPPKPSNQSSNGGGVQQRTKVPLPIFTLENYFKSNRYIYYGTVSPIVTSIVIILNIFLIATIIRGKFRTSTYVVMVAIALADCLTGLSPLPFNIYAFSLQQQNGYLTVPWCYAFDFLQMILPEVFHLVSLHLTIGLAIERFIVVTFPLKARRICTYRNGILFSGLIFVTSICSQMDLFVLVQFTPVNVTSQISNETLIGCLRSSRIRTTIEFIIRTMFVVFLPCLMLIIFTVMLICKINNTKRWRKLNTSVNKQKSGNVAALDRMNLAVILILVCVTVSEITVWTCLLLSRVNNIRFTTTHEDLMAIGLIVLQITSPINFLILCCLSEKFRQMFKEVICCCCKYASCVFCAVDRKHSDTDLENSNYCNSIDSTRF